MDPLKKVVGKLMHPVGSIYMSVDDTSPADLFGGTWERVAQGRTLYGAGTLNGNVYTAGSNVEAKLPNIKGTWSSYWNKAVRGVNGLSTTGAFYKVIDTSKPGRVTSEDANASNSSTNGYPCFNASGYNSIYSDSCSTVQPNAYVVFMWKRTA